MKQSAVKNDNRFKCFKTHIFELRVKIEQVDSKLIFFSRTKEKNI
jgi:hypothetical protein